MNYYMTLDSDPSLAVGGMIHAKATGSIGFHEEVIEVTDTGGRLKKSAIGYREDHIPDQVPVIKVPDTYNAKDHPYIIKYKEKIAYNPDYGDERICKCGHEYERHFDWMDDDVPTGCKYCGCFIFEEQKKEGA